MGTDISGWVEIQEAWWEDEREEVFVSLSWQAVVCIDFLVARAYNLFAYYFGYGRPGVEGVAPGRGLPPNPSREYAARYAGLDPYFVRFATWIAWPELIEATERERVIGRIACGTDGSQHGGDLPSIGTTWATEQGTFRVEPRTLGQELDESGFALVLEMMAILAGRFGPENVRLCVVFD